MTTIVCEKPGRFVAAESRSGDSALDRAIETKPMKFTYASGARPLDGYTIKRGVGHGGFGEVYYAVSDGGKEVAIKLVQRNLDIELRGVAQCMNLKHPNLVTLYDLRTNDSGEHFVVMEFVSGNSLADLLAENAGGLTLDEVNRWLQGICAGIGYLHDKGIVHRDLKPGNVFIEDGVVKIGDYGLSKFITASRRSGQTESVGTVHYMAPEISRGKYDREIDVYATGIMLYEMITGDVPFDGESVGEILMKHLTAQPDVSRLPAPYDHVVSRALAKDPTARYRSMEELTAGLNGQLSWFADPTRAAEFNAYSPTAPDAPQVTPAATLATALPIVAAAGSAGLISKIATAASAWWLRPWGAGDYLIAAAVAAPFVLVASEVGFLRWNLLPWVFAALFVLWLVRRIAEKNSRRSAGAAASSGLAVVLHAASSPTASPAWTAAAPAAPVVAAQLMKSPHVLRPTRHVPRLELPPKGARQKIGETASAMLLSAVLCTIGAVAAAGALRLDKKEETALLAATCLAGCWAVVIPSKIWEGRKGDAVIRRLILCGLGIGVGLWNAYLDGLLNIGLFQNLPASTALLRAPTWLPLEWTQAAYFGLVFASTSWWMQVDSRRGLRLNPWLVIVPSFWAMAISWVWSYPQPWGVAVTAMISTLVQLASPWEDAAARRRAVV